MNDLTTALGDLADAMTDDPARLVGVHRKARALQRRRTARRGAVATGALGVAAATGVVLRPSGGSPDTQVTATQPPSDTTTPPTTCPPTTVPSTTWPADAHYVISAFMTGQVSRIHGDDVTIERLSESDVLPSSVTLTLGPNVEYADGDTPLDRADLQPGQIVEIIVQQPEGGTGWELAHVQITPGSADEGLPEGAVVDGNSVTLPC